MPIEQNPTQKKSTQTPGVQNFSDSAGQTFAPIQKRLSEIPMPSKRTQMIIASGIALGAVGILAYVAARRKPRFGLLASLTGPAMVAWSAYQKAAQQAKDEIQARLH